MSDYLFINCPSAPSVSSGGLFGDIQLRATIVEGHRIAFYVESFYTSTNPATRRRIVGPLELVRDTTGGWTPRDVRGLHRSGEAMYVNPVAKTFVERIVTRAKEFAEHIEASVPELFVLADYRVYRRVRSAQIEHLTKLRAEIAEAQRRIAEVNAAMSELTATGDALFFRLGGDTGGVPFRNYEASPQGPSIRVPVDAEIAYLDSVIGYQQQQFAVPLSELVSAKAAHVATTLPTPAQPHPPTA